MRKTAIALLGALFLARLLAAGPPAAKPRARDLGVPFEGTPGPANAITDVAGVEVGHATIVSCTCTIASATSSGATAYPTRQPVIA